MPATRTLNACGECLRAGRALKSKWRDVRPVVYFYRSRNGAWLSAGPALSVFALGRPYGKFVEGQLVEEGIYKQ